MKTNADTYTQHCQEGVVNIILKPFIQYLNQNKNLALQWEDCNDFWEQMNITAPTTVLKDYGGMPVPSSAKRETGLCEYELKKGDKTGQKCGKKAQQGKKFCCTHARLTANTPSNSGPTLGGMEQSSQHATAEEDSLYVQEFDADRNLFIEPNRKILVIPDKEDTGVIWAVGRFDEGTKSIVPLTDAEKVVAVELGLRLPTDNKLVEKKAPAPKTKTVDAPLIPPTKNRN